MANTRTAVAPFGAITVHRFVTAITNLAAAVRAWNQTRRTVNALRALSRAQLEDIGLTPADVEDFSRRGF